MTWSGSGGRTIFTGDLVCRLFSSWGLAFLCGSPSVFVEKETENPVGISIVFLALEITQLRPRNLQRKSWQRDWVQAVCCHILSLSDHLPVLLFEKFSNSHSRNWAWLQEIKNFLPKDFEETNSLQGPNEFLSQCYVRSGDISFNHDPLLYGS